MEERERGGKKEWKKERVEERKAEERTRNSGGKKLSREEVVEYRNRKKGEREQSIDDMR